VSDEHRQDTSPQAHPANTPGNEPRHPGSAEHHGTGGPSITDRLASLARLWRAGNAAKRGLQVTQAARAATLLLKGKVLFWVAVVAGVLIALFAATIALAAFMGGDLPAPTGCAGTGTLAPAGGVIVGASEYGGPGDPSTPGDQSASGIALDGHMAFAELGLPAGATNPYQARNLGTALGYGRALPFHSTIQITADGRSVIAEKLDVGAGGPPVGDPPHQRDIDLWWQTAQALGVDPTGSGQWSGLVTVRIVNLPPTPLTSITQTSEPVNENCDATPTANVSASGETIVQIAQSQLGVYDGGDYLSPYSHGRREPWCSDFVSWVWQHASINIPDYPFSGDIYTWGQHNTQVLAPTATPAPGDAVEFGTGPQNKYTSVHVGIVENVFPDGEITVINGDYNHHVERSGPFQPSQAAADSGSESPIYAYVQP
jgi:hypothetical protein